jgi:hypothetical protein
LELYKSKLLQFKGAKKERSLRYSGIAFMAAVKGIALKIYPSAESLISEGIGNIFFKNLLHKASAEVSCPK